KRRDRLKINIIMQVDTMCHKIPNFVEKSVRAGCKKVFIGLESINPDSLKGASKDQNRITEYRKMLQAWKRAKVLTYAGYILGFPSDTPESIERDIQVFGAAGVSDDIPIARMWRDSRSLRIADGPDEVHRMTIARRELRKYK